MAIVKYEAKNFLTNTLSWNCTAFKAVLIRRDWMLLVSWAIALAVLRMYNILPSIGDSDGIWKLFGYFGFLLAFSLCFFLKDCYTKYNNTLKSIDCVVGRMKEVASLSRIMFKENMDYAETIVRLLNATHHIFYYETAKLPVHLWKSTLLNTGLITRQEFQIFENFPSDCYYLCWHWLVDATEHFFDDVIDGLPEQRALIFSESYQRLLHIMTEFRRHLGTIEAIENLQKIPFPYYHFLCLSIYFFLFGLGLFASMKEGTYFSPAHIILCLLVCLTFLALFHTALELADPLGTDDNDIEVPRFIKSAMLKTRLMQYDEFTGLDWIKEASSLKKANGLAPRFLLSYQDMMKLHAKPPPPRPERMNTFSAASEFAQSLRTHFNFDGLNYDREGKERFKTRVTSIQAVDINQRRKSSSVTQSPSFESEELIQPEKAYV